MGEPANIFLVGFLVIASISDLKTRKVPNLLVAGMIGCWIVFELVDVVLGGTSISSAALSAMYSIIGALFLGGFVLVLTCVFERLTHSFAMGGGDIKLIFAIALYLGFDGGCVSLLIACLIAVLFKGRARTLPFAPALTAGAVVALLAGLG